MADDVGVTLEGFAVDLAFDRLDSCPLDGEPHVGDAETCDQR